MSELPATFEEAALAFRMGNRAGCTFEASVYSELRFTTLLMQYAQKPVLVDAAVKELEPLLEEDRRTNSELVKPCLYGWPVINLIKELLKLCLSTAIHCETGYRKSLNWFP